MRLLALLVALPCLIVSPPAAAQGTKPQTYSVGVAKSDITPAYPVRLSGFAFRRTESEGVTHKIWARALAINTERGEPAVLIAVDNLGLPWAQVQEVARRLEKAGLKPERLAITATHTHTAPMLKGVAPTLFGQPIPKDHQERIDRYSSELTENLEKVARAALADRKPARLSWGIGQAKFAINRRPPLTLPSPPAGGEGRVRGGGPVDHDLPVLVVRDLKGKVRAVHVTYACHCVTLSDNKISGDWAGYAQEMIEDDHPGSVGLVSIGTGADSNPSSGVTKDKADIARGQGAEIAREARRLMQGFLAPVTGDVTVRWRKLELPLDTLPTKEEWEKRAKRTDPTGYHARVQLARLARGEKLRTKIDYPIQVWTFGESLAMAFLPGEVVVDYGLRLKKELDRLRLCVCAYSNDSPCYIPSERVLKEGGYEGGGAMIYYDVPVRLAPGLEAKIVDTVKELAGPKFKAPFDSKKTGDSRPLSPQQSRAAIKVRPGLKVVLVAAEPLVTDPVAIDFGPDGKLWVCEMHDYPSGTKGDYKPGGRIKLLEDTDGDGKYDRATVFLDNIPFPTGVTVWRKGVLVCAAPDILYAEDTDGDGKADMVRKVFSGFGTGNYQARVNSLEYGLDGWIYGSCGMFGGKIACYPLKDPAGRKPARLVELGDRDFRIKPDEGLLEPATGRTQQGRVRDDWGNWFGCDNSTLCRHYPLADHYLRRNPHLAPPPSGVLVPGGPDPNRLYPLRQDVQLFKLSGPPGRTTGACGLGIYRDDLLGKEFTGNAFVCEPVNLLVHRMVLSPRGSTFTSTRAKGEEESEFLASTDTWFRPVQVRTGPDGGLWVVDMYRFVIEHPRWIPPADLAKLDLRAGSTMGRIYRVVPEDRKARPMPRLDRLDTKGLVAALDSPNGWQRDMASQLLLWQRDKAAVALLERMTLPDLHGGKRRPEAFLHTLCVLAELGELQPHLLSRGRQSRHPGVLRHLVRLTEPLLRLPNKHPQVRLDYFDLLDAQGRLQYACSLGESPNARFAWQLGWLAGQNADDPYLTAAVLSSTHGGNVADILEEVLSDSNKKAPAAGFVQRLLSVTTSLDDKALAGALEKVTAAKEGQYAPWQLAALTGVLEALQRRGRSLDKLPDTEARDRVRLMLTQARKTAADGKASEPQRLAAVRILGRDGEQRDADLTALASLLKPEHSPALQSAAATALGRIADDRSAVTLVSGWKSYSPSLRGQVLDLLLSRADWQRKLLQAIAKRTISAAEIDAARRQRLLTHRDGQIRSLAEKLFAGASPDRQKVLDVYQAALTLKGDPERGHAIYRKTCSACHRHGKEGHSVGPDLAALATKTPQYLLQEILDPNRNLDTRYLEYVATTQAGRIVNGTLASESATSVTLRGQEGKDEVLLRSELESLRSTGRSLMPEGLEKDIPVKDMADLLAFLTAEQPADAAALARQLLDDKLPQKERQAIIERHPDRAAELVAAMTADLKGDRKEEYRRIPWIWRVSVAAGKRNDAEQLRRLLEVSLPKAGEPLLDWQVVVVGGGVINGISLQGAWPGRRLDEILKWHAELAERWRKALPLAAVMMDDEKVPTGTRYDAQRMIALDSWKNGGARLAKYLAKGVHNELQMGAISGLSDIESPEVPKLLAAGLGHYSAGNRKLALDALLRTEARAAVLLDALEKGQVQRTQLAESHVRALRALKDDMLRARAVKLLAQ
ncbi:MAG: neutral/alkaline non-lysosomal ceramidase N-terminal domain-containing protein [Gemmataceae bacterium]|nr:neutral/alkaline non-lysosomal ceramidase N-terminal domain-containing protein [Gemmataceae bacterium]